MRGQHGRRWERRAAEHLAAHGLSIIERGYHCRLGELDLVCRDGRVLVVVEVRARSSAALCSAIDSVGHHKQRRIIQATRHFLLRHREWQSAPIRFDVVAFDAIDTEEPELKWIKSAFDGC